MKQKKRTKLVKSTPFSKPLLIIVLVLLFVLVCLVSVFFMNGSTSNSKKEDKVNEVPELKTVDVESLSRLVEQTKEINRDAYTPESLAILDGEVEYALQLISNPDVTQAELDDGYQRIINSIFDLVLIEQ